MKIFVHLILIGALLASTTTCFGLEILLGGDSKTSPFISILDTKVGLDTQRPLENLEDSEEEEELEEQSSHFDKKQFVGFTLPMPTTPFGFQNWVQSLEPEKRPPRELVLSI